MNRPPARGDLALQGKNSILEFEFLDKDSPGPGVPIAKLIASSATLDYTVLELEAAVAIPVPRLVHEPIVLNAVSAVAVNIVQHPRGEHKQVAFQNNLITAADTTSLRYFTDTDGGSSGSPVSKVSSGAVP